MSSEGSREIQAARQRLAVAKAQKVKATKMAETADAMAALAQKNKEDAQSQLRSTQDEVEAAEAFLEEAEGRWEVVEVDDPDGDEKENAGRAKKKRKTPAAERTRAAAAAAKRLAAATAAGALGRNDNNSAAASNSNVCKTITVAGSGTAEVNGTYKRDKEYTHYVGFEKMGEWKGKRGTFRVSKDGRLGRRDRAYWYIRFDHDFGGPMLFRTTNIFRTKNRVETDLPPESGWMTLVKGESPPPRFTLH